MNDKSLIKTLSNIFSTAYKGLIIILTIFMFLIVGMNVFSRYILNYSLAWADELSRFIFVWVSFLGAVLAYYENEHVGLDFIVDRMPSQKIQMIFRLIGELGILLVIIALSYFGWIVASSTVNNSPALNIPMKFFYMIVPISAVLMAVTNIQKIINHIKLLLNKNTTCVQVQKRGEM
ncbi:MAG: TRAP-type transport system small permease protein [Clostridiales bacterium]|nr:TRAP-type transport system small permease protein [Clostridiales bacterium]MDK2934387.1 TRAP-type transport system small permease protein [Clostridiales bacterium]